MKTTSLRARSLACALLATTAFCGLTARPAAAQTAHTYRQLDANGVDLTHGDFLASFVEGSIGSGESELTLVRSGVWWGGGYNSNGHQWDQIQFNQAPSGNGFRFTIIIGGHSETFDGTGTIFSGSSLSGGGGSFTYVRADGTRIEFGDPAGSVNAASNFCNGSEGQEYCSLLPLEIDSPDGNSVALDWDIRVHFRNGGADNIYFARIVRVSNGFGYSIGFTYASNDHFVTSAPPESWHQRTGASFYNDLVSTTAPQAGASYSYPGTGVTEVTDMGGLVWRFTGDQNGIGAIRRPGASSDTTTITGTPAAVTSVTNDGVTTAYSRSVDTATNVATMTVTQVVPGGTSPVTTIVSDLDIGRPTAVTDPLSHTTAYQYDSNGRLTKVTAPEGNYAQYTYDARGNVTQTDAVAKSGSGLATITTSASYDTACSNPATCNRPNSVTDARGNTTDYTYDSTHGGVLSETGPAPTSGAVRPQTRYAYTLTNGEYRVTGISICRTTSACEGGADEVKAAIAYDSNGNVASTSAGSGDGALTATSAMTYDALGNLLTVDGPLPGTVDTSRIRYDSGRRVVGTVSPDPDGAGALKPRAVRNSYADGLLVKVEQGNVDSQSDPDWALFVPASTAPAVEIAYDGNARPVVTKLTQGSTVYALTQANYDALGRPDCTAQRMNPAAFASLPASACSLGTPGTGANDYGPDRIARTLYDAAGQVTQVKTALGTADAADPVTATYTTNGLVQTVKDGEGHLTTYDYDGHDRLAKIFYPDPNTANVSSTSDYEQIGYESLAGGTRTSGLAVSLRNRSNETIAYGYDALGRLTSKDMPGSELDIGYGYDLLGRMTSASQTGDSQTYEYDALGRNVRQTGASGDYRSEYDLAGRRTRLTHPDGFFVAQEYLVTGEMTRIREIGAASGVGVLASYDYEQLGRRERLTLGNGDVTAYQYDSVSRLWKLTHDLAGSGNDNEITLSYNPASQIVRREATNLAYAWTGHGNGSTSSSFDGLNRLVGYSHDARGNRTSDGTRTYTYDSENKGRGVATTPYQYDPLGRLSGAGSPLAIAYENYVDNLVAERTPGSSTVQRRHVFGPGTDEPLVWYEGSDRRFLHADERGSIVSVTSSSGALLSINRYDEYGRTETTNTGNYLSRFGYTGQRYFGGFGLYHYKNRMYDPRAGRFMQPDPIGYDGGMNLYPYVGGDPVNFIDPLGLDEGPIVVHGCQEGRVYDAHEDRCVPDNRHLLPRNPTFDPAEMGFAMLGWATCVIGLVQANKDVDALQRADDNMGAVNAAAANNGIDPRLLAAIGVRESGFQSVVQSGGRGVGVFQIDLGKNPLVTRAQALDVDWAADFAANMLHDNMVVLASRYDPLHLLQATAASYNLGRRIRNLTGNPKTIDNGTPGGDYGASVVNMMACF
jgi:RHS repeat-associated protein